MSPAEAYKYQVMPHDAGQIRRSLERKFNLTFIPVARIRASCLLPYSHLGICLPTLDHAEHQPLHTVPTRSLTTLEQAR
jgi:hypothetical protein